jgi:hypothetical protein
MTTSLLPGHRVVGGDELQAELRPLSRYFPGQSGNTFATSARVRTLHCPWKHDSSARVLRTGRVNLWLAAEAVLQVFRLLGVDLAIEQCAGYLRAFRIWRSGELDRNNVRFLDVMVRCVIDGV